MTDRPKTNFKRWREHMGFTQAQAADALGISADWVKRLDAGKRYDTGAPAVPDHATRIAMAALANHPGLKPWPE